MLNNKQHIPAQVPYDPEEHPFAPHEKPLTGFQQQILDEMRKMSGIMEKFAKYLAEELQEDDPTGCPAGLRECEHPMFLDRCDLCPATSRTEVHEDSDKEEEKPDRAFICPVTEDDCDRPDLSRCAECDVMKAAQERKKQKDNEVFWHLVDGSAGQVKNPVAGDIVWVVSMSVHRPCIGLGLPMIVPGVVDWVDKPRGRCGVRVFSPYDQLDRDYKPEFLECTYTYGISELFPSMEACVRHYLDAIQGYAERNAWELRNHLGKESIDVINDKLWSYLDNEPCATRGEPEKPKENNNGDQ